jgi:hypothetical protein
MYTEATLEGRYLTPARGVTTFLIPNLPFQYWLYWNVAYCFWCWERLFERKGAKSFAMKAQVGETLFGLFDCGNVTRWHPPEGYIRAIEALKPLLALLQYLAVLTFVDEN